MPTKLKCKSVKEGNDIILTCDMIQNENQDKSQDSADDTEIMKYNDVDSAMQVGVQNKQLGNSIGSAMAISLISGFGFAVAYMLLYVLYDYMSNVNYQVNWDRFVIVMIVLFTTLFISILIGFLFLKKSRNQEIIPHNKNKENSPDHPKN